MSWIVLLASILLLLAVLAKRPQGETSLLREDGQSSPWVDDILSVSSNHTQVAGFLAGFTVTATILVATARFSVNDPRLREATMGAFLLAFLSFITTGVLYSVAIRRGVKSHQEFIFSIASCLYYLSVVLTFSALVPLLLFVNAGSLIPTVKVMLLGSVVGGYFAVSIATFDLLRFSVRLCLCIFLSSSTIASSFFLVGKLKFVFERIEDSQIATIVLPSAGALVALIFVIGAISFNWSESTSLRFVRKFTVVVTLLVTTMAMSAAGLAWNLGSPGQEMNQGTPPNKAAAEGRHSQPAQSLTSVVWLGMVGDAGL